MLKIWLKVNPKPGLRQFFLAFCWVCDFSLTHSHVIDGVSDSQSAVSELKNNSPPTPPFLHYTSQKDWPKH